MRFSGQYLQPTASVDKSIAGGLANEEALGGMINRLSNLLAVGDTDILAES